MKRTSRRHRNPHLTEKAEEPFFSPGRTKAGDNKPFFQAKGLKVGKPGDKYEKEADAVADAVVNHKGAGNPVQRKEISTIQRDSLATPLEDEKKGTAEQRMEEDKRIQEKPELQLQEDEEELQMQPEEEDELQMQVEEEEELQMQAKHKDSKAGSGKKMTGEKIKKKKPKIQASLETPVTAGTKSGLSQRLNVSKGKGEPFSGKVKNEMDFSFGADFTGVRIHTGRDASELNNELHAQAFTHDRDIFFNSGKYNPETEAGKKLLAHELTHVIQQTGNKNKGGEKPDGKRK
jgi:hypothetical protein